MDRKLLKEKERELKENVKGKPFFLATKPKIKFMIEVFKLVWEDIKTPKQFRSKKSETQNQKVTEIP